jgi:DNA-binding response OmpR family regulator
MQPKLYPTASNIVTFLSVSPHEDDHASLKYIIGRSNWQLLVANNLSTARALLLQRHEISVVLCERDLMPGSWTDVLDHIQTLPVPPSLIVTSRLADDRLWSEVLNLSGWDVLGKPFVPNEVLRSVKLGWDHFQHQIKLPAFEITVTKEAS